MWNHPTLPVIDTDLASTHDYLHLQIAANPLQIPFQAFCIWTGMKTVMHDQGCCLLHDHKLEQPIYVLLSVLEAIDLKD